MDRSTAVDRVCELLDTLETDPVPVPVRSVWVLGDLALGLDPVERIDLYLRKDLLFASGESDSDAADRYEAEYGIAGVGTTISAEWAEAHPNQIRTNANGYAAPEQCLAAHLIGDEEPIHLEVCNARFEHNVTQRLQGGLARDALTEVLDPRAVCVWQDETRSDDAITRLREGEFVFPPLEEALEMIGMESEDAERTAEALHSWRSEPAGASVRGDVLSRAENSY